MCKAHQICFLLLKSSFPVVSTVDSFLFSNNAGADWINLELAAGQKGQSRTDMGIPVDEIHRFYSALENWAAIKAVNRTNVAWFLSNAVVMWKRYNVLFRMCVVCCSSLDSDAPTSVLQFALRSSQEF